MEAGIPKTNVSKLAYTTRLSLVTFSVYLHASEGVPPSPAAPLGACARDRSASLPGQGGKEGQEGECLDRGHEAEKRKERRKRDRVFRGDGRREGVSEILSLSSSRAKIGGEKRGGSKQHAVRAAAGAMSTQDSPPPAPLRVARALF